MDLHEENGAPLRRPPGLRLPPELAHITTRPYTPRTNGKAERFIQTALREGLYAIPYDRSDQRTAHMTPWLHGRPLDNGIQSVTVRAPTCMLADAWATAVMVLGEPGLELARAHGLEVMIAVVGAPA